jgi:hypothetical protein
MVKQEQDSQPNYSVDWFSHNIPMWDQVFDNYNIKGKSGLRFLEIGCFEGRATNYMLDNILTADDSTIDVVDTFGGSLNEGGMQIIGTDPNYQFTELHNKFLHNIQKNKHKVNAYKGNSSKVLREMSLQRQEYYDFVYIDGSHTAYAVLEDAVLVHPMIKPGGILIFDDYLWKDGGNPHPTNSPELAVNCFYTVFELQYEVVFQGYQVGLLKK